MKFLIFFLLLWVIFALLGPDPDSESGYGSTDLIESGSNPDPEHCCLDLEPEQRSGKSLRVDLSVVLYPRSWIQGQKDSRFRIRIRITEFKYFNPKNGF